MNRPALPAALALVFNAMVWGLSWIAFHALQARGVHPLWVTTLVMGLGVLVLLLWQRSAWRALANTPLLWLLFISAGLSNVGFNWAVTIGDVVRVALLFYTMPAWTVLLAWLVLRQPPRRAHLLQLVLALAGVVVVLKKPGEPWPFPQSLADYLSLMAGFSFALTNVLLRRLRGVAPASLMLTMLGGGAGLSLLTACWGLYHGLVPTLPAPELTWLAWTATLALAPLGESGALLLDPTDITISGLSEGGTFTGCVPPNTFIPTTGPTTNLNVATLQTNLASCAVTVSTHTSTPLTSNDGGSITVQNAVTWSSKNTLTLRADSYIYVGATISNTGPGSLVLVAENSATLGAISTHGIEIAANITTATGNITLTGNGSSQGLTPTAGVKIDSGVTVSAGTGTE